MDKFQVLKQFFGYDGFRPGQEKLIDAILSGRDVLGILPTGAGKSICFQIPALMMGGITLVISPLISLMKDQVASLNQAGVHAAYLNSSLTMGQYRKALAFAKGLDVVLIPYELAQGMKETREILAAIQPGQSVGIFIGPEGGFEEEEVRDAMEAGGKPVTLGKRILRTETAGMTMLSILMYTLESV